MELIKQDAGELTMTLTVKLDAGDYMPAVEQELKARRRNAEVKGFRKGMVPMGLVKRMYGQSTVLDEVNKLVTQTLNDYLQAETRIMIGDPIPCVEKQKDLELTLGNDLEFIYQVGFYGDFELELDNNIVLPYNEYAVEDDEVDKRMDYYRRNNGERAPVDSIDKEDMVRGEIEINGEPVSFRFLMQLVPAEQQPLLMGTKVGEVIDIEFLSVFPNRVDVRSMLNITDELIDELPAMIPMKIVEVTRRMPAELNQAFYDMICGEDKVHSEEEFRAFVYEQIKEYHKSISERDLYQDGKRILMEMIDLKLPKDFVKEYYQGLHRKGGGSESADIEMILPTLMSDMAWDHISSALMKKYGLSISEEEIVQEAHRDLLYRLSLYGIDSVPPEQFREMLRNIINDEDQVNVMITLVRERKFTQLLLDKVTLDKKVVSIDE